LDHFCPEAYYNEELEFAFGFTVVVVELATVEDHVLHHPDTIKHQDLVVFTPGRGTGSHSWSIDCLRDSVDEEDEESKFRVKAGSDY